MNLRAKLAAHLKALKNANAEQYMKYRKVEWVVVYDPSISEKTPYYVELQFDGQSAPGGSVDFFETEERAVADAQRKAERNRRQEELGKQSRVVTRIPTV